MATYFKRRNADGTTSILTIVKVGKFKPVSRSFKTSDERTLAEAREEARAWAEPLAHELKTKGKRGGFRSDLTTFTVGDLIREYLADPKTKALKSYETYHDQLDWWVNRYRAHKILDFNVRTVREAREALSTEAYHRRKDGEGRQRSAGTVNRYLSAIRSAWNWGRSEGLIPQDRHWSTRILLPEPAGRVRYLSDDEMSRLLKAAEADPVLNSAIRVSIATGIRQGELLRLTWSDIDLDGNSLQVLKTKNDTPRAVYLPPSAVDALRRLKEAKVVSPTTVFLDPNGKPLAQMQLIGRWERIRDAAGLVNFRWHDLRHSCASVLAQNGANLLQIGSVLGHKSPSVTKRYAHLVAGAAVPGHAALDALLRGK